MSDHEHARRTLFLDQIALHGSGGAYRQSGTDAYRQAFEDLLVNYF
jgi:hypothetical protein